MGSSQQQNAVNVRLGGSTFDPDWLVEGVLAGDVSALAQSITLIESTAPSHRPLARNVLARLAPHRRGKAQIVAISGVPGAGKSSFIEALGNYLCDKNLRVAVLAADPSSPRSGGSILGDKTRMETLAMRSRCFIRPSPTGGALGGVTRRARETVMICEAAGFDVVLIETVGVGQSEIAVRSLVDCVVLMLITGAGDDLQGIKKGIVEIADILLVNKADGDNQVAAETTRTEFEGVMQLLSSGTEGWRPPVLAVSAHERRGIEEAWKAVSSYFSHLEATSQLEPRRQQNSLDWYRAHVAEELYNRFQQDSDIASETLRIEQAVLDGSMEPSVAAELFIEKLCPSTSEDTASRSTVNSVSNIRKIDHIGIAVHSISQALPFYRNVIGIEHQLIEEIDSQKVRVAMLAIGEINIELLEPTAPDSTIAKFLQQHGEGIHHIAFATDAIESKLDQARKSGVKLIHEVPLQGAHNKLVAFLHPKSCHGVLTEFCQVAGYKK